MSNTVSEPQSNAVVLAAESARIRLLARKRQRAAEQLHDRARLLLADAVRLHQAADVLLEDPATAAAFNRAAAAIRSGLDPAG